MIEITAKPHLAISDDDFEAMRKCSPEMYWTFKRNCIAVSIMKKPGDSLGLGANTALQEVIAWLISNASDLYHYAGQNTGSSYRQSVAVSFCSQNDALAFKLRFDGYNPVLPSAKK